MPSKPQPASLAYKDMRLPAKKAWQKSEDALQIECAKFAKKALYLAGEPQVFHHSPNGGNRTQREAAKFKMMGVLSGVPDTFLPLKSGKYCGLYIELKKAGGSPSKEQKDFLTNVAKEGYLAIIVNDLETFKEVFTYYIQQRKQ